jgi:DNA-binding GntR family transcriptional regulator
MMEGLLMISHKSVLLADQIFDQLENDILCGKYQRGEVITENKLSEELGVSRTPVRDALRRLTHEHLIADTAKGSVVIGISTQDMLDGFEVRARLESLAASRAAEEIPPEGLKKLKETLDLQEFYTLKDDPDHIRILDSTFHETIYRYSGSTTLYEILLISLKKVRKYRLVSVTDNERAKKSVVEHKEIYDAIAAGDKEAAAAAVLTHINNARNHILETKL